MNILEENQRHVRRPSSNAQRHGITRHALLEMHGRMREITHSVENQTSEKMNG